MMKEKEKEIILNKSLKRKAKMHISLVKKVVYNPKKVEKLVMKSLDFLALSYLYRRNVTPDVSWHYIETLIFG